MPSDFHALIPPLPEALKPDVPQFRYALQGLSRKHLGIRPGGAVIIEECGGELRLKPSLPEALAASYPRARQEAANETGLPLSIFPDQPPFTWEQVLDEDYWPEPGER